MSDQFILKVKKDNGVEDRYYQDRKFGDLEFWTYLHNKKHEWTTTLTYGNPIYVTPQPNNRWTTRVYGNEGVTTIQGPQTLIHRAELITELINTDLITGEEAAQLLNLGEQNEE